MIATTRTLTKSQSRNKRYIGTSELRKRWNNCSHMTIERRLKSDPDFPKPYRFTRFRLFDLDEIEAYERNKAGR